MGDRLCLDFGTAYSKAAKCVAGQVPEPLRVADAAAQGGDGGVTEYTLETAASISGDGILSFGARAIGGRQTPFIALKESITRAAEPSDLDRHLPSEFNPTLVDLSVREVVILYLAFLVQAALVAASPTRQVNRLIALSVTTPAFETEKAAWVSEEMASMLTQAELVARRFGIRLFTGVPLREAVACARVSIEAGSDSDVDVVGTTEPVAAFAGRLLHYTPGTSLRMRNVIMVVDVGAGTTDFALFGSGLVDGLMTIRHIEYSHRSLPVAGNAIDEALVSHALTQAGSARRRGADVVRASLRREARSLKEELFKEGSFSRTIDQTRVEVSVDEFMASEPMERIVGLIRGEFDAVLRDVLPMRHAGRVVVHFSGGGASLPFLRGLVPRHDKVVKNTTTGRRGQLRLLDPSDPRPAWHSQPGFDTLWEACGGNRAASDYFGRLAVSLGGAYFLAEARNWLHLDRPMLWPGVTREAELLRGQ